MNDIQKKLEQLKVDREVDEHNESHEFRLGYVKAMCHAINLVKNLDLCGVMPRSLTVENGAKNLLCGEINELIELSNPEYCGCGECDFCIEHDNIEESYMQKVPIKWITMKDIYAKIVAFYEA